MADKATDGTETLVQSYNKVVESAIGAFDTGVAQATTTVKLLADAAEAERGEFGKMMEQGTAQARKRNETLAAVMPGFFKVNPGTPGYGYTTFAPETQESVNKLVEGEMAFYEACTQAWVQYVTGFEQRRSEAAKSIMESNAKVVESGQCAARDAAGYGEALFNWSMETVNSQKA